MASSFIVKEHQVEAQHIREYPHATANSQETPLLLSVKQYIPKSNPNPKPGDITILAAHANGFVKELYEPLWEDLLRHLSTDHNLSIRSIWIADVTHQGQSGILNERELGNDPSWIDHARDLLHLTNVFRKEMPRPIIGLGHSFGANVIVRLSLIHPRLLSSVVLLDAVLSRFQSKGPKYGFAPMLASAYRRDFWPSREDAVAAFRKNKFYSTWDPRVFDKWCEYGLRDTPTALYEGDQNRGGVTLTTSKHMESFTYYRPTSQKINEKGQRVVDLDLLPDADDVVKQHPDFMFYRAEGGQTAQMLPGLRPGALWVFGAKSEVNPPEVRQEKLELTGVGVGGSGGAKKGRVEAVTIEGYGHLVPMERTDDCAKYAADFIVKDLKYWREEQREFDEVWKVKEDKKKWMLDEDWDKWMGGKPKKGDKPDWKL
ncbi:Alpha/beta hydrolase family-domain-containing protein [Cladorrhinum samala]|uniref:Alpha/beta hydrolase family-domain-containing protein n=1 Tax=Cladorrhinum samala TaxID=585594 RepID=A0AAV9HWH8_9PEZI|nr:Alpha/beta hydrolase family-domain-containing protein [Cladorrhinum samala]